MSGASKVISGIGLAAFVVAGWPGALHAQPSATGPATAASAAGNEPSPEEEDETAVDELVVTARRAQPGAVVGDVKPELQLGRTVIQSYGVSTVTELLDEIAPQIRSERGRGNEPPVVLLNGRRISGMSEVRDVPTEAILRVDVLPEEAALKYGYPPDQRVVNIVLRRRFRALSAELKGQAATDGGDVGGEAELDLFRVHRDSRANFDLKYQQTSAITEAQRDLTPFPQSHPYARAGNVVSPTAGAEIDPALSALVGQPVTIAGVPTNNAGRPLTVADFAATAGVPNVTDARGDRTLTPAIKDLSANAVLTRPVFGDFNLALNANLTAAQSESRFGLPGVRLLVPAGDPFSPFGSPVEVDRYPATPGALRRTSDDWSGHLGSALNGDAGGWRLSLAGAYDHADVVTRSDAGADAIAVQALLLQRSGAVDPFSSPLNLPAQRADKARSRSDAIDVNFVASGAPFKLPAGAAYASLRLSEAPSWLDARSMHRGQPQSGRLMRNDFGSRASLDLPIARNGPAVIGDLWLNVHGKAEQVSDFGALTAFGYGANWTPAQGVNLIVSHSRDETAPTLQQLGAPLTVADRAYVFDFPSGQSVDVRRLAGGDRNLLAESSHDFKVGLKLTPFPGRNLVISATYLASRIDNPIEIFPAATSAIQQAFPSRFTRDAAGRLVAVDVSPVNFAEERRRDLRWGVNYAQRWGSPPSARRALSAEGSPPPAQNGAAAPHVRRFPRGAAGLQGTSLQFALYHTVYFEDAVKLRPQDAPLDLLAGAPAGPLGGRPRHEVEAQAGVTHDGFGARMSADWRSATSVRDPGPGQPVDLTFSEPPTLDLRLFANFDGRPDLVNHYPWLRGVRLTVSAIDLFDSRIRVRSATGATPLNYQSAYLEPVGRVLRVSFRKLLQ